MSRVNYGGNVPPDNMAPTPGDGEPRPLTATERMAKGYAARPPGPNVRRALERRKAEREAAAAHLRAARAKRLKRRNPTSGRKGR